MGRLVALLAICALVGLATGSSAVQVITNGDFEGGSTSGVPNGWTRVASTVYSHDGYTADWRLFSDTMNNYPTLDVYAGANSLGVYRTDGGQRNTARPGLDFFEFNVLYQTIPVNPSTTYYVKASAAAFVHHDRMNDIEDFWGAGAELRICPGAGVYDRNQRVWCHAFWNWDGDSFWRYHPLLNNQVSHGAANSFTTGPTQTSVTFSIVWLTKWNAEIDMAALDDIQVELTTTGPAPVGTESYVAKNPPTWTGADPIWSPTDLPVGWSRGGAIADGGQFHQAREVAAGMYPRNSAVADFNGDGLPDIAVANEWSHLVSVHLQRHDGSFAPAVKCTGALAPKCVQAAQMVGGPALDLVVTSGGTMQVLVYPGNGDGTFGSPFAVPVDCQPTWVAPGDFNNDGSTDFAVGVQLAATDGYVHIYMGDGQGGFFWRQTIGAIWNPSYIIAADFGGEWYGEPTDGILDLALLAWGGNTYVYTGDGTGLFNQTQVFDPHGRWKSTGLAAGNFDGDANNTLDLCVTYMWESNYAQVLSGIGGGWFMEVDTDYWLRPATFPSGVDGIDYDLDGQLDLAFSNYGSPDIVLYRNHGYLGIPPDGLHNYVLAGQYGVGNANTHVLTHDMNVDGYADMVVTSAGAQTVNVVYGGPEGAVYAPNAPHTSGAKAVAIADFDSSSMLPDIALGSDGKVKAYRNNGGLAFTETFSGTLNGTCVAVRSADFNTDGKPDLAAIGQPSFGLSQYHVFLGDGAGGFAGASYAVGTGLSSNTQDLAVADIDNANGPDLVASESYRYAEGIYSRVNSGAGTFVAASKKTALPLDSKPRDLTVGDFNGDGKKDVVVALSGLGKLGLLTGRGDGVFNIAVQIPTVTEPTGVCSGDFNGDGKLDVAVTCRYCNAVRIHFGAGDGTFTASGNIGVGVQPAHIETSDIDADGKLDLLVANAGEMTFSYLRGNGDGTFQPRQDYRTIGDPCRFAAADLRGIGLPDVFVAAGNWEIFRNALLSTGSIAVTDDGASQDDTTSIGGSWSATTAAGRSIVRYRWAVSTTPDASGIIPGGGWLHTTSTSGSRDVSLSLGQTYYILAQAEDSANLLTPIASSDGIAIEQAAQVSSPAQAKLLADGRSVVLTEAVVSRVWAGDPWVCYVQDSDRTSGIRVTGTGSAPTAGVQVTVTGAMGSFGSERMIEASGVQATGTPGEPLPVGLIARALGGGSAQGQTGALGAVGTNNIGLLVRVAGTVTRSEAGEDWFYVDDGSTIDSGGVLGVKCLAQGLTKPSVGTFAVVTGISGLEDSAGQALRCVRVQRQADIRTVER